MSASTVLAAHSWRDNGELIADVAALGYLRLEDRTLDMTWGRGRFWTRFRPTVLVGVDLNTDADVRADNADLPFADSTFDAVVYDPPYKLNGTPSLGDFDNRYGVDRATRWQDRHDLIIEGIDEAARVLRSGGVFLLKCQDQVCSGAMRWQTDEFSEAARNVGLEKIDRFDLLGKHRPQPMEGRTQRHAHGRPSTLLVFRAVS